MDVQLFNADCRILLGDVSSARVALITDSPYGINLAGNFNNNTRHYPNGKRRKPHVQYMPKITGDEKPFDPAHLLRFEFVCLWGAENFADKLPTQNRRWFVWDKRVGVSPPRTQGDCEMAWVNQGGVTRVFRHLWDGMVRDSERGIERVHPTQKPITLFKWCIQQMKLPAGTLIVDPYLGSGSCGVAAIELGFDFIGIEIETPYFQHAQKRIAEAQAQLPLIPHEGVTP